MNFLAKLGTKISDFANLSYEISVLHQIRRQFPNFPKETESTATDKQWLSDGMNTISLHGGKQRKIYASRSRESGEIYVTNSPKLERIREEKAKIFFEGNKSGRED